MTKLPHQVEFKSDYSMVMIPSKNLKVLNRKVGMLVAQRVVVMQ